MKLNLLGKMQVLACLGLCAVVIAACTKQTTSSAPPNGNLVVEYCFKNFVYVNIGYGGTGSWGAAELGEDGKPVRCTSDPKFPQHALEMK